jgi:hypothetical protein
MPASFYEFDALTCLPSQARPYSGLMGNDRDALKVLMQVHSEPGAEILDCTFNSGKMWAGILDAYHPVTLDIDPIFGTDYVGDFRHLSDVIGNRKFDVLVFDPPHLPLASASENSSGIWRDQYGLVNGTDTGRDGDNVSQLFRPFFREAVKVLRPDGVVFCKMVDMIHNHRYQWQHIDLVLAARLEGMTPCDMLVKIDPCGGNLKSSKWKNVHHLRRNHCFWIVVRNSHRCERRIQPMIVEPVLTG